jgi:succinate dehydrogenase / fumarate reductase membrane anchor subunit
VNDYATKPGLRRVLHTLILISTALLLLLGTLVIYTFDPCPVGSPADLLPSFCEAL